MPHHAVTPSKESRLDPPARAWATRELRLCGGLAAVLLLAGLLLAAQERRHDARLPLARGEVVALTTACGYQPVRGRGTTCKYFPVVRFVTRERRHITFRSNVGRQRPAYAQGQAVDVRYDPGSGDEHADAMVVGYGWRGSSFCYLLAWVALATGTLLTLAERARQVRRS